MAKAKVLQILRELSAELQSNINVLVFSSTLLIIGKALFAHVRYISVCYGVFYMFLFVVLFICSVTSIFFSSHLPKNIPFSIMKKFVNIDYQLLK